MDGMRSIGYASAWGEMSGSFLEMHGFLRS